MKQSQSIEENKIIDTLVYLKKYDPTLKVVGSLILFFDNNLLIIKDIDILTEDISNYQNFNIEIWNKKTPMSKNGIRGKFYFNNFRFDVFQKEPHNSDEFILKNDIPILTKNSLFKYWEYLINSYSKSDDPTSKYYKKCFIDKINIYKTN